MEAGIARSHGTCMTMGTAATMMGIAEAIGLTLPGASSIPAADANHIRMSAECGRRIVEMVWDDLTPAKMLTRDSFDNGIAVAMARAARPTPSSTWSRCRAAPATPVTLDDFDAASRKVPVIANIRPSGDKYLMEDFYYAGGMPALMKRIARAPAARRDDRQRPHAAATNIAGAEVYNDDVIRPLDNPIYAEGALAVLRGNLAPDGVVIKPSACAPHLLQHTGRALVFDDYPALKKAVDDPTSTSPATTSWCCATPARKGAGMPEWGMLPIPTKLLKQGVKRHAAPVRRAHERHQLRRLPAALLARGVRRRPAGAGEDRRPHHASTCRRGASTSK